MADTIGTVLREATRALQQNGCDTAALDARLLLQAATGLSHADIIADPDQLVREDHHEAFSAYLKRRLKAEPVSRILGVREFYGRDFKVTPAVLDPRPDTEVLVDAALGWAKTHPVSRLLDLGTGTGILAVTLLAEWPGSTAVAVDVSSGALAVAADNAKRLGVSERLTLVESSWFGSVEGTFDLIVSNPPYIREVDIAGLAPDVTDYDPHLALTGGADGLDPYRHISASARAFLRPGGAVFVEIGEGQAQDVSALFKSNNFNKLSEYKDLAGHIRILAFYLE